MVMSRFLVAVSHDDKEAVWPIRSALGAEACPHGARLFQRVAVWLLNWNPRRTIGGRIEREHLVGELARALDHGRHDVLSLTASRDFE